MVLGAKLLTGLVVLAGASCGGYVVYKKVSGSSAEVVPPEKENNSSSEVGKEKGSGSTAETQTQQ